jgi:hypothetical protein
VVLGYELGKVSLRQLLVLTAKVLKAEELKKQSKLEDQH